MGVRWELGALPHLRRGLYLVLISIGAGGRDGSNDQRATQWLGEAPALSPLQSGQDDRKRALPSLSDEAAGADARRPRRHSGQGYVDGRARAKGGGELLRRSFPIGAQVRRRPEALTFLDRVSEFV